MLELNGVEVSPDLISTVADAVLWRLGTHASKSRVRSRGGCRCWSVNG
jgi:hypothetical protein